MTANAIARTAVRFGLSSAVHLESALAPIAGHGGSASLSRQASAGAISCKRLTVVLIKPSKYDDEGYVIRHFRGVLPSNTLACLSSLTEDLKRRRVLGRNLEIRIRIFDDTVQPIPVDRIIRSNKLPRNRTVVALVGVQSNQFPRAADLARRFRAGGLQVLDRRISRQRHPGSVSGNQT